YLGAFLHRNRNELAVHLWLDPDFRGAHHADDGAGRLRTSYEIDHRTAGNHGCDDNDGGTTSPAHVAVLSKLQMPRLGRERNSLSPGTTARAKHARLPRYRRRAG